MQRAMAKRPGKTQANYPDKLFYKIGEVSKIAGVEPYVLRYWESEFSFLKPRKSKSGQRIYVKKDLELILQIKDMLYDERFTIEGVRRRFTEGAGAVPAKQVEPAVQSKKSLTRDEAIEHVKARLRDILAKLD
jgi:DNA-binding transcriptional MerR regulator